jgi:hypothetical protein
MKSQATKYFGYTRARTHTLLIIYLRIIQPSMPQIYPQHIEDAQFIREFEVRHFLETDVYV